MGTPFVRERYEILSVLGHGGQGEVARALDHQHDRVVALKILEVGSEFERRGLLREARMLFSLQPHPGLPIVREDFFDGDRYCIVMDWVEGVSLSRVLADRGAPGLPPPEVAEYVSQTAAALDHLHGHEPPVVHQDVKPGNLILVPDGHVVLVDFGLSVPGGTDRPGRYGGTRGYAAPELAAGTATAAADVYGLAATAFALLTGGPPRGDLPTWENIPRGTAGRVEPVIRQGLSIDPDRRQGSPGAFAAALADAVGAAPAARIAAETQVRTFLIADVRGYTSFTRERGDEAAARLAAAFAEVAREGVESRDGEVIELRGDEALAVFRSARQALRAAVELQVVFQDESSLDPTLPLAVGIGLDAGEAVPVEGGFRGAALNLAARLCASAGPGEVLVSQGVVHLASTVEGVRLEERVPLDLKGLDAPVPVWQATHDDAFSGPIGTPAEQRRSRTGKPQVLLDVPPELDPLARLVGRDRDARWIRWAWRQARRGPGRIVVVTGSEGAGKTLLAAEAAQLAAREGGSVAYASSRRSSADVEMAIAAAAGSLGPTLLVLDDLEAAGDAELAPIAELVDRLDERCLLVVGILRDGAAPRTRAALERLAGGGEDRIRRLGPFDHDGVRAVAALYLEEPSSEVPVDAILQATGGAPVDVHRMAVRWAEGEAARRLGGAADVAARERVGLRTAEADVVGTVIDLQRVRERGELLTGPEERPVADEPPFKGLASFDVPDARYFFGRERLVAEMVARLAGSSFLAVVGPSGSGKSSAVRAGLLPTLAAGALPGSEGWIRAMLRPGEHPERELDRVVFAALPERLRSSLGSSQTSLEAARSLVDEERGHLLVVVDQAEELFTVCHDDAERERFLDSLTSTVRASGVTVLVAIRADFYGRCSAHPALAELVADNHVLVGPMTEEEYRRAIELPARLAGLRIDRPLVDALVGEVIDEPGGLPLLSTALLELWQRRHGRAIRLESYSETGGVRGAVARLAEQAYAELTVEQQAVAKGVLLRLSAGEGEVVTRRRVPILEFDPSTNADVGTVLDTLIEARLLIADDGTIEVAHEALLREWPRLEAWLDEDRAGRRLREHLTDQAKEWERSGKEAGDLYRGPRLASALDWTAEHAKELNDLEREFLSESSVASEREAERQRRTNRRLRGLLIGTAAFLVVALLAGSLALIQRGHARDAQSAAEAQALRSDANRLGTLALTEPNLARSYLLAVAGVKLQDLAETRGDLLAVLQKTPALVRLIQPSRSEILALAVSPDGRLLATGDSAGVVRFDDLRTWRANGAAVRLGGAVSLDGMAFSPDGGSLAVATASGGNKANLYLVDVNSRSSKQIGSWRSIPAAAPPLRFTRMAFSPDGSRIAVAVATSRPSLYVPVAARLLVLEAATGRVVWERRYPLGTAVSEPFVAFTPKGVLVTSAQLGETLLWNTKTGRIERHFPIGGPIAISPDGRTATLAQNNADSFNRSGSMAVLDLRTGAHRSMQAPVPSWITSVRFTPDGASIVGRSTDAAVRVWDVGSGSIVQTFTGQSSGLSVAVTPDGRTALAEARDGSVAAWDLSGIQRLGRTFRWRSQEEGCPTTPCFVIDPKSSLNAEALYGGTVGLVDLRTRHEVATLPARNGSVADALAFFPDGRILATGGISGKVTLWDLPNGPVMQTLRFPDPVYWVAVSPDGKLLAVQTKARGSTNSQVVVREVASGEVLYRRVVHDGQGGVEFSPDGRQLAALGCCEPDSTIEVWDARSGGELFSPHLDGHATSIAFSPDGRLLAAGTEDGKVVLWNAGIWKPIGSPIQVATGFIDPISFSADGRLFAASSGDQTATLWGVRSRKRLGNTFPIEQGSIPVARIAPNGDLVIENITDTAVWPTDLRTWVRFACRVAGRDLTRSEWSDLLPDRPYRHVCPR